MAQIQPHLPDTGSSAHLSAMARAASRPLSVGVIGAGIAGLRCADVLIKSGCKVTILEARNRIGGRIAHSSHLGREVDLGPNWIHGSNDNPIMQIARKTGTQLKVLEETMNAFDADGNTMSQDEVDEYSTLLWDGVITAAFRHSKKSHQIIDPKESLYDFITKKAENTFLDQSPLVAEQKRAKFLQLARGWGAYIVSPITRQSLKFFWLEECLEGENPFVAGTYHKILEAVADPAKRHADIRLGCEVIGIRSERESEDAVSTTQPCVETADGNILSFDEVVVTTPLGWLKENRSIFDPALPPKLSQAIDSISYGHLDKVYVSFPSAFWSSAISQEDTCSEDKSHQSTDPGAPGFTFWLQPSYAASTNPEQWLQECVDLSTLPPDSAHPTLLFYIQGPQSKYIADLVDAASSEEDRDAKLISFFMPYISKLHSYDEHSPECVPRAVLATCWANDRFAGYGSYSNFQVGLEDGDKHIGTMRHGLPDRGIWLAGEHTAPFIALGTTTGAYWSGEAVAKRIIHAWEKRT